MFEHEAGFEGKTNCLPWLALLPLDKLVPLVDCLFAPLWFLFFFGAPDQALTSGGVSREVAEGEGKGREGSPGCLAERSTCSPRNEPPSAGRLQDSPLASR